MPKKTGIREIVEQMPIPNKLEPEQVKAFLEGKKGVKKANKNIEIKMVETKHEKKKVSVFRVFVALFSIVLIAFAVYVYFDKEKDVSQQEQALIYISSQEKTDYNAFVNAVRQSKLISLNQSNNNAEIVEEEQSSASSNTKIIEHNGVLLSVTAKSVMFLDSEESVLEKKADIKLKDNNFTVRDIAIVGEMLAVVSDYKSDTDSSTKVEIYNIDDLNDIKLERSYSQSGEFVSLKLSTETEEALNLFTKISEYNIDNISETDELPDFIPSYEIDGVEVLVQADNIYLPKNLGEQSILAYTTYDIAGEEQPITNFKAFLGNDGEINITEKSVYLIGKGYKNSETMTNVFRFENSDTMNFLYANEVEGDYVRIERSSEHNNTFRIFTTHNNSEDNQKNVMTLFNLNLENIGEVKGFTADNIDNLNYNFDGDKIYVVNNSSEKAIFSFDLSDYTRPRFAYKTDVNKEYTAISYVGDGNFLSVKQSEDTENNEKNLDIVEFTIQNESVIDGVSAPIEVVDEKSEYPQDLVNFESTSDSDGNYIGVYIIKKGDYGTESKYHRYKVSEDSSLEKIGEAVYNKDFKNEAFGTTYRLKEDILIASENEAMLVSSDEMKILGRITADE